MGWAQSTLADPASLRVTNILRGFSNKSFVVLVSVDDSVQAEKAFECKYVIPAAIPVLLWK